MALKQNAKVRKAEDGSLDIQVSKARKLEQQNSDSSNDWLQVLRDPDDGAKRADDSSSSSSSEKRKKKTKKSSKTAKTKKCAKDPPSTVKKREQTQSENGVSRAETGC